MSLPSKLTVSKATTVMPAITVVSISNSTLTEPDAESGVNFFEEAIPKGSPVFLSIRVPVNVYSLPGIRFVYVTLSTSLVVEAKEET